MISVTVAKTWAGRYMFSCLLCFQLAAQTKASFITPILLWSSQKTVSYELVQLVTSVEVYVKSKKFGERLSGTTAICIQAICSLI